MVDAIARGVATTVINQSLTHIESIIKFGEVLNDESKANRSKTNVLKSTERVKMTIYVTISPM